ncbi:MAG: nucleoside 2-deoxyribosyltransferase [Candidatus Micrarchaeales archaeon]|jgi:nucleoside 2-deoxyribosyltransferase
MTQEKVGRSFKMYIASPLGFTEEGRDYIRNKLFPKLVELKNVEILDPWKAILEMSEEQIMQITFSLQRDAAIRYGKDNFAMIDESDIVLANLNGTDPDSGTCIEVGYAHKAGKLVVGYRTDYRASGESHNLHMNLQVEAAVEDSGGKIFRSLEEAVTFIKTKTETIVKAT